MLVDISENVRRTWNFYHKYYISVITAEITAAFWWNKPHILSSS